MSYIDFKNKKNLTLKELDLRKRINENQIEKKQKVSTIQSTIKNDIFNKKFKLIEEQIFKDIIFKNCKMGNLKFVKCKFIRCIFENCEFNEEGTIFEKCIFTDIDNNIKYQLNKKERIGCIFNNCSIYVKFDDCDMSMNMFENCNFFNTNFEKTNCENMIISKSEMKSIEIKDCNFRNFKVVDTYIVDLMFEDENITKFNENTFFDKINIKNKTNS